MRYRIVLYFFITFIAVTIFSNPILSYRVFKTKHVDVIYQEGLEASIYDFIQEIDKLYEDITNFYGIYPDERLRVIITDDTDISNASAIPFDDSIHIYACGNSSDEISSDYKNWYRFVFTHEFTHVLLGNYYNPYYSVLRTFGNPLPSLILSSQIPLYLHEGLSIFTESKFNSIFGRLNDARFQMYIRADLLSGKFKGLELAGGYFSHREWAPAGMMYEYGASLIKFISKYYGETAVHHFLYEFFKAPGLGVSASIQKLSGENFKDFVDEWKKYELRKAEEVKRWVNYNTLRTGRRLTHSGWWTGIFDVTKNGHIYYFEDKENSESALMFLDLKTDRKKKILDLGKIPRDIEISPSGRYIAMVVNSQQYFNLFNFNELVIYDTFKKRFLSPILQRVVSVDWLNEESLILLRNDRGFRKIQKYDLKTNTLKTLLDGTRGIFINSISCYNDSIYFSGSFNGQNDLFVLKLSNSFVYRLTNDVSNDLDPEISEDGRYLCFVSDSPEEKYNIFNVYIADLKKQRIFKVTNVIYGSFKPRFYKGSLIYRGYTPDGYDIFFIEKPYNRIYETHKKLYYDRFDHTENILKKRAYVAKRSIKFSNYIKPRIWMFLPYLSITEDSAQFMMYQFNAFWDTFVENLVLSYGVFRTAEEPINFSLLFVGKHFVNYSMNFNFKYSFKESEKFEGSMNGKAELYIPFGNPLKTGIFIQGMNIQVLKQQNLLMNLNSALMFDQVYSRYFDKFWRTTVIATLDLMKISNWNLRLMNSFVFLRTFWNFETSLKESSVTFNVKTQTPVWIIDKGTLDGKYSIGSIDFVTKNGLNLSLGSLAPISSFGFKVNFAFQYYVEIATELGIKYEGNRVYPYFQLSPKLLDLF